MSKLLSPRLRRIRHNVVTVPIDIRDKLIQHGFLKYDIYYKYPQATFYFAENGIYTAYIHRGSLYVYIPTWLLEAFARDLGMNPVQATALGKIAIFFRKIECTDIACIVRAIVDRWEK